MPRKWAKRWLPTIGLLVTAVACIGVAEAIPFEGTLNTSQPIGVLGHIRIRDPAISGFVAAWEPSLPQATIIARDSFLLTVQETRWKPAVAVPGAAPTSARQTDALETTIEQIEAAGATLQGIATQPNAKWVVLPEPGRFALTAGVGTNCTLKAEPPLAVELEPKRVPFTTRAWTPRGNSTLSAHCAMKTVTVSGAARLLVFGTNLSLSYRDAFSPLPVKRSIQTGLLTTSGPTPEARFVLATISKRPTSQPWVLPGAADVWIQSSTAEVEGKIQIPPGHGEVVWGQRSDDQVRQTLAPEGSFFLASSKAGLTIRGSASNYWKSVPVGVGILAAAAAAIRAGPACLHLLFTRLKEGRVLEHSRRRAIRDAVSADPGIHPGAVARILGVASGVVDYHVAILSRAGVLSVRRFGRRRALYVVGTIPKEREFSVHRQRQASMHEAAEIVRGSPGISSQELSKRLRLSRSRAYAVLAELRGLGLVEVRRVGGQHRFTCRQDAPA